MIKKLTEVRVLDNYRIWLHFDDGIEGEVDFSLKPRTGVYAPWQDYDYFRRARVGPCGELFWDDQVDFSPDSLWFQVTGRVQVEPESGAVQPKTYA